MVVSKKTPKPYRLPRGKVLVLRTCNKDLSSHGGFQWKDSGVVSCDDWSEVAECGRGLHGLLWGQGDGSLLNWNEDARWIVAEVAANSIVDLHGKVKFPKCKVVYCGAKEGAVALISLFAPAGTFVAGGTATAGDEGTATAGYRGIATAGYGGIATAGYRGTATAGHGGTATAGYGGIATAGDRGIATAGYGGIATAGDRGTAIIKHWDSIAERYRMVLLYPGENGIKANVKYRLDESGSPVEVVG